MKQSLLKHYGKIALTILVLGLGAYFHKDVSDLVTKIDKIDESVQVETPVMKNGADAGL